MTRSAGAEADDRIRCRTGALAAPLPVRTREPTMASPRIHSLLRGAAVALRVLASLVLLAIAAGLGIALWIVRDLPSLDPLLHYRPALPSVVVDRAGRRVAEFYTERRRLTPLAAIPPRVAQAFLASEDANFF